MRIFLPPVRQKLALKEGDITKEFARGKNVHSALKKHNEKGHDYYTIKHGGNDMLVFFGRISKGIKDKYRYVMSQAVEPAIETVDALDISHFEWIKNPLLEEPFTKTFTRQSVLDSWKDAFKLKTDEWHGEGLRIPQAGALYAIQAHWAISDEAAIIVMPTGTGKTDTMIATLMVSRIPTLLIVVPTDALRGQLAAKFLSLGVLPQFEMVGEDCDNPLSA